MKLNLGCGQHKVRGFVNVDMAPECGPDQTWDLEKMPWPWETSSVTEVLFNNSLEHLGFDPRIFLALMKELYRVCADGCLIRIAVPHPRHDQFLGDPTHVRAVTPQMLNMFSRKLNEQWKLNNVANTPLGLYLGVDFELLEVTQVLDDAWHERYAAQRISPAELQTAIRERNNVVRELRMVMKAVKAA